MDSEQRVFGARMFACLANPSKLHILEFLAQGPASVNDISNAVGIRQSITSQHLSSLLNAGVVVYEKVGTSHIYKLRGPRITRILELVKDFYMAHLNELKEVIASQQ